MLGTLGATLADGVFLDAASARYPAVVLGSTAARRLGIARAGGGVQVVVGGRRFTVVGILDPVTLVPSLDSAALVGFRAAGRYLDDEGDVSSLYVRSDPEDVEDVRSVLARTVNPEQPDEVDVSRPSDAIEARAAAKSAFTSLFLGLGAVALLVGGVGIANVMVISVLERRSEIGLRRSLGATRRHVGLQFLTESLLLSLAGGVAGVALGAGIAGALCLESRLGDRRSGRRARRRCRRGARRRCRRRSLPGASSRPARPGRGAPLRVTPHSTRSAPSNWRIGSRAPSGTGDGRRVSRSTSTSVWEAVTSSSPSERRYAAQSYVRLDRPRRLMRTKHSSSSSNRAGAWYSTFEARITYSAPSTRTSPRCRWYSVRAWSK